MITTKARVRAVKSQVPDRYDVYVDGVKYWHGTKRQVEAISNKYGYIVEFNDSERIESDE